MPDPREAIKLLLYLVVLNATDLDELGVTLVTFGVGVLARVLLGILGVLTEAEDDNFLILVVLGDLISTLKHDVLEDRNLYGDGNLVTVKCVAGAAEKADALVSTVKSLSAGSKRKHASYKKYTYKKRRNYFFHYNFPFFGGLFLVYPPFAKTIIALISVIVTHFTKIF